MAKTSEIKDQLTYERIAGKISNMLELRLQAITSILHIAYCARHVSEGLKTLTDVVGFLAIGLRATHDATFKMLAIACNRIFNMMTVYPVNS